VALVAVVCAVALLAVGCAGADNRSDAVGELVLGREDGVYAIDLDSGDERRIGSDAQYGGSWSPSGTKVAVDRSDGTMLVTTIATGARERLDAPPCYTPVWAPDEKTIACDYGEPWIISTLELQTGEKRTLTDASVVSMAPAWSPHSQTIAYVTYGALMLMGRDGSGKHRVADAGSDPDDGPVVWSPDGRQIAYLLDNSVWIVNVDGGERRMLLESGGRGTKLLAWSPDGRHIAVTHGDGDWEIFVIEVESGEARNLTDNDGVNDQGAVWSPDSRYVAYISSTWDDSNVLVARVDGGEASRVSEFGAILHWSPALKAG
jgi:Tol biopolymer transport system component